MYSWLAETKTENGDRYANPSNHCERACYRRHSHIRSSYGLWPASDHGLPSRTPGKLSPQNRMNGRRPRAVMSVHRSPSRETQDQQYLGKLASLIIAKLCIRRRKEWDCPAHEQQYNMFLKIVMLGTATTAT